MATTDPTPIEGAAGLVKSTTISTDSQTTVMRTGKDILETASAAASLRNSCNATARKNILGSVFGVRGKSNSYKDGSNLVGEFNTKDGELNG